MGSVITSSVICSTCTDLSVCHGFGGGAIWQGGDAKYIGVLRDLNSCCATTRFCTLMDFEAFTAYCMDVVEK